MKLSACTIHLVGVLPGAIGLRTLISSTMGCIFLTSLEFRKESARTSLLSYLESPSGPAERVADPVRTVECRSPPIAQDENMAVEISGTYHGGLKMELRHGPSGALQKTAAPVDNQGDGSSFSPTDLVAAALGSCAVTTMAIVARRHDIPFEGATFHVEKHMRSDPRRIDRLPLRIQMPAGLSEEQREILENAARTCPVEQSLLPEIERVFLFDY